jgi:hypothetical protein
MRWQDGFEALKESFAEFSKDEVMQGAGLAFNIASDLHCQSETTRGLLRHREPVLSCVDPERIGVMAILRRP